REPTGKEVGLLFLRSLTTQRWRHFPVECGVQVLWDVFDLVGLFDGHVTLQRIERSRSRLTRCSSLASTAAMSLSRRCSMSSWAANSFLRFSFRSDSSFLTCR